MPTFGERGGRAFQRAVDPQGFADEEKLAAEQKAKIAQLEADDPNTAVSQAAQEGTLKMLQSMAKTAELGDLHPDIPNLIRGMSKTKLGETPWLDMLKLAALGREGAADRKADIEKEKAKAAVKAAEPTPFETAVDKTTGEAFAKQREGMIDAKNRLATLNDAVAVANQVETGPLAGQPGVYFAQTMTSNDAQRLENYLAQENVRAILEFADRAGVRGIDTEKEQERITSAIANRKMDRPTLIETLNRLQRYTQQGLKLLEAKQAYAKKERNLRDFDPSKVDLGEAAPQSSLGPRPAAAPDVKGAMKWLKENPKDPRAAAIKKRLGLK